MRTIQSEFQKHGIKKNHNEKKKKQKKHNHTKEKPREEKFSEEDMRYLMGTNRATYKRHKGAFRQR